MARTKTNTNININYKDSVIIGDKEKIEKEIKSEVKKMTSKIKVKFFRAVISDYGTFTIGQEEELEERIANKMINGGYAEKC